MELIDLSSHSKNELIKKLKNRSEQYVSLLNIYYIWYLGYWF